MAIVYQNGAAGKICANRACGWKPLSEFANARSRGKPVGDGFKSRCRNCWNAQRRKERAAKPEKYKETARKYVEANKEHIRELKRRHQTEHPEKYEQASRRYLTAHRKKVNIRARLRRKQDLEHYREIGRKSYERHADKRRKYSLEYYKLHPEKSVAATNRRRALMYDSETTHTEEEWQDLKAFYEYKCLCCGRREPEIKLTRDHVIPLTKGGNDSIHNIQPLCARCNSKKNQRHIDYR
jgi:5-methylcytosine-specific restriction endonuclease McrA